MLLVIIVIYLFIYMVKWWNSGGIQSR